MPNEIVIERMQMRDMDAVLSFLARSYPDNPRHSDPNFWAWHFLKPPAADDASPAVWLAKSGHQIAGQMAGLPVELFIDGEKRNALWALDFIVDPEFRRRGIGKKLALAMEADFPYLLGVNTDEQHAPALLQSLGWVKVARIPRFHRLLYPGNAVREIARVRPLRKTVNVLSAPMRRRRVGTAGAADIRVIEGFNELFDRFWETAASQWPCAVGRNKSYLDWQFRRQPGKRFDVIARFDGNRVLGYAVQFFRKPDANGVIAKAAISDLCYGPERPVETVDLLIDAAVELAIKRKAGGLVTDATDKLLQERLKKLGFWPIKSPLQLMAKVPENADTVYDIQNWYLTRGDSDISIFEDPNLDLDA
jgi:GNAT superfamily N-acetyltransferase